MKTSYSSKSTIKIIQTDQAVKIASQLLFDLGYMKVSGSRYGSCYFSKLGSFRKIRVSNHRDYSSNSDVFVDVVIDYPTIMSDIAYRIKNADSEYKIMMHGKKVYR